MSTHLLALGLLDGGGDVVVKVLAIVGGGTLGGLVIPWVIGLVVKVYTTRNLPNFVTQVFRVLSGLVCALIVYLFVFGGGGGGLGGSGGWTSGSGGNGKTTEKAGATEKSTARSEGPIDKKETLTVEVLGNAPLTKIEGDKIDLSRRYRVKGEAKLLTLDEVKQRVKDGMQKSPPLRALEIVVYDDSPSRESPVVRDLDNWAREVSVAGRKLVVDVKAQSGNAPS